MNDAKKIEVDCEEYRQLCELAGRVYATVEYIKSTDTYSLKVPNLLALLGFKDQSPKED